MREKIEAHGWLLSDAKDFDSGIDTTDSHSGDECAYLKSVASKPKSFGFLSKSIKPGLYLGNRIKMSAWVKTKLEDGASVQLWLRADGAWKNRAGCFDNMYERAIEGTTEWASYDVAVDVPGTANRIVFGVLLNGIGQVWIDDVLLEMPDTTPVVSETQEALREDILKVLSNLSAAEQELLRLRFGLDDGRQRSLADVGLLLGITKEQVRNIEGQALQKLRRPHR
jgi:RNA polymerase sigma factor (sigma-70 family)